MIWFSKVLIVVGFVMTAFFVIVGFAVWRSDTAHTAPVARTVAATVEVAPKPPDAPAKPTTQEAAIAEAAQKIKHDAGEKAIRELIKAKVIHEVKPAAGASVDVIVNHVFYAVDFEIKRKIAGAVIAYYGDALEFIDFKDRYSGKVVATWSKANGFAVQ